MTNTRSDMIDVTDLLMSVGEDQSFFFSGNSRVPFPEKDATFKKIMSLLDQDPLGSRNTLNSNPTLLLSDRQLPDHGSNWKIMNCPITTIYLLVKALPPVLPTLDLSSLPLQTSHHAAGVSISTVLSIYFSWSIIIIVRVMDRSRYHQSLSLLGPIIHDHPFHCREVRDNCTFVCAHKWISSKGGILPVDQTQFSTSFPLLFTQQQEEEEQ